MARHLSAPIETEPGVVYLLRGVRILLERSRPDPKPFALWMHCHWALHMDLSSSGTTKRFLEGIDKFVVNNIAGLEDLAGPKDDETFVASVIDEHHLSRELVYLDSFREQLREFLNYHGLPTELCTDDQRWYAFVAAYAGVIEDGSLSINGGDSLKAVARVIFSKGKALPFNHHIQFRLRWEIVLKDRRMCRCELDATPSSNMIFQSITIVPAR